MQNATHAPGASSGAADYREAVRLVRAYIAEPRRQSECLRTVRLLALARAVGVLDEASAVEIVRDVQAIADDEIGDLAVSIRQGMMYARDVQSPDAAWLAAALRLLEPALERARALKLLWLAARQESDWRLVVARGAELAGRERTLVIFGLGQNGQIAARAAKKLGIAALACDDRADIESELKRIEAAALGAEHVVLVTPDANEAIAYRLDKQGVVVMRPERIWGDER